MADDDEVAAKGPVNLISQPGGSEDGDSGSVGRMRLKKELRLIEAVSVIIGLIVGTGKSNLPLFIS